jgi:lysine-N-methylase
MESNQHADIGAIDIDRNTRESYISMNKQVIDSERAVPPTYAGAFQCIGAQCEDSCCHNWDIPLDKKTYEQYQRFPEEKLGSLVRRYVIVAAPVIHDNLFASIEATASGSCPFYTSDRLCSIQKEYGPQLLSSTCSIYPRVLNVVEGELEGSLMLSCPEAARNILLVPNSLQTEANLLSGGFRTDNRFHLASNANGLAYKPYGAFHEVRACVIALVKDRSKPMWLRLLRIGSLCKELSEISNELESERVPAILSEYLPTGGKQLEVDQMPGDCELNLKVVFKLADERVQKKTCGSRFLDTYWNFVEGIGSDSGEMPGDDVLRFQQAEANYCGPFFESRPYILENYLLNYIFNNLFPFGRVGSNDFKPRSIFDEYLLMATQFAMIRGLLTGIAGHYKEEFSEAHVVKTIQSYAREVDHKPSVVASIVAFVHTNGLANLQGMAALLRMDS